MAEEPSPARVDVENRENVDDARWKKMDVSERKTWLLTTEREHERPIVKFFGFLESSNPNLLNDILKTDTPCFASSIEWSDRSLVNSVLFPLIEDRLSPKEKREWFRAHLESQLVHRNLEKGKVGKLYMKVIRKDAFCVFSKPSLPLFLFALVFCFTFHSCL